MTLEKLKAAVMKEGNRGNLRTCTDARQAEEAKPHRHLHGAKGEHEHASKALKQEMKAELLCHNKTQPAV